MRAQEPDRLNRVKASVIHSMMCWAKAGQVIRHIVCGVVIQVRRLQTRSELQATDDAATEWIGLARHPTGFGLVPAYHGVTDNETATD